MFKIVDYKINDLQKLDLEILKNPSVGGIAYFQGVVRDHNEGKSVTSLEYEAYAPMGNKIGLEITNKSMNKFDIVDAYCIHRIGHLEINDTAVWVVVTSHHRREAFEACQYIIDTVKQEVPIWKREHYTNEDPKWVACHRCIDSTHEHHHHD
jgi:molybdopterin synthase catalytic subunit